MMEDVKARRIDCIIVKDLSRFGRNYIEAGKYLEQVFPFLGVRFIAITDDTDTGRQQSDAEQFVLPFKNLFNDSYCKDISTKVRSQLAIKRKNGQYVGNFACYGYLKDPADHNQLIIDPEASIIVQRIFYWKIQGLSADRIADKLNRQGILCPMEYKRSLGMKCSTNFRTKGQAQWAPKSVIRILKNEFYVGTMVQGRKTTPSYKVKKIVEKPEHEWDRVEDTHEAIIHKDVFDVVQSLLLRDTRIAPSENSLYLFSGFLCCADCGMNMIRSRRKYKDKVYAYYSCSGYKRKSGCESHMISEVQLYDAVLAAIKQQCYLILEMERLLKVAQDLPLDHNSTHQYDIQITKLEEQVERAQDMKIHLIENLNEGIITPEDYKELNAIYDKKIKDSRLAIQNVKEERDGLKGLPLESEWLSTFKKHSTIQKLDRIILAELIDFIEVHKNKGSATIDIKRSQGPHYLGIVPYGYIMSDGDDRKFVIDTTVAPFVRLLFDWVLEGHSFVDIARNLNDMNVPTPKQYYYDRNNGMGHQKLAEVDPNACWNSAMVRNIALNRTYTGDFVYFKSYHRKYDLANSRDIPEEEWLIYPDSHEAYISHDKYQRIRTMIEQRQNRRSYNASRKNIQIINKENPFSKLLFCGECRRQIRFQKNYANLNKSSYYCNGNSTYSHHGHKPLRMEYRKLLDIVRFHIQLQINAAIEIEEFLNRISLEETKKQLKLSRQNIVRNLTAKQAQIKNRKQRAYEDLSNHLLDQETYQLQKEKLDREAHWLEGDIARARQRVLDVDHYFTMDNEWLQTVLSVRYSEEIDSRVIHLLISKIEIYRENQIHIIYNCADWMEKLQSCVNEIKREG